MRKFTLKYKTKRDESKPLNILVYHFIYTKIIYHFTRQFSEHDPKIIPPKKCT